MKQQQPHIDLSILHVLTMYRSIRFLMLKSVRMNTKLTLTIEKDVIKEAKVYAKEHPRN